MSLHPVKQHIHSSCSDSLLSHSLSLYGSLSTHTYIHTFPCLPTRCDLYDRISVPAPKILSLPNHAQTCTCKFCVLSTFCHWKQSFFLVHNMPSAFRRHGASCIHPTGLFQQGTRFSTVSMIESQHPRAKTPFRSVFFACLSTLDSALSVHLKMRVHLNSRASSYGSGAGWKGISMQIISVTIEMFDLWCAHSPLTLSLSLFHMHSPLKTQFSQNKRVCVFK